MRRQNEYTYRFLARVVLETVTPLTVGTGGKEAMTDAPVAEDVNGLPYIPGTALAGVVRHLCEEDGRMGDQVERYFGFHGRGGKETEGSLIVFTDGLMIGEDGMVVEGVRNDLDSFFYRIYQNLPIRHHVCITDKGVGKKGAKYDGEVVYAGSRFCFEIEMGGKVSEDVEFFKFVLSRLASEEFRIGGNTRNGLGVVKMVDCKMTSLDLSRQEDLEVYLEKSSSLAEPLPGAFVDYRPDRRSAEKWQVYELTLTPDDFFFFGSGSGDAESVADMAPVREDRIVWDNKVPAKPSVEERCVLIPATSVKGALAHRVAFHYNLLKKRYAGKQSEAKVGNENEAVRCLFGYQDEKERVQKRGKVLLSDMIFAPAINEEQKYFNHVSVDYFTGGAIAGALFTDKVDCKKINFSLRLMVDKCALEDKDVRGALEASLDDICTGMLPLGGGVNRGYGCFNGSWILKKDTDE